MGIHEIIFEMKPVLEQGFIELSCRLKYNGEIVQWREVFEDTDFESRAEALFDYMKRTILGKIKEKLKK